MLTRSGWGAIALAAAAFVIGRTFGIVELFVLGVGVLAALAVAVATMLARPPRLVVRRLVSPPTVQAGDAARVDLQVANAGNRRTPVLQLWEPVGTTSGATMNLAPLRPRERTSAAYRLPTSVRGVVSVGPMRARRRDVLGLASRTFLLPGTTELLVLPRHSPVRISGSGSSGRLGEHLRMRAQAQSGSEFHSLREYVQGDDLRRISWKASARTNELIVKETALEGLRRCTVVLDTTVEQAPDGAAPADPDEFERAVSAAASLVVGAAATGLTTRFVALDTDLRGPDVAAVALRWLAIVRPGDGAAGTLPTLRAGEGIGIVVVVTTTPDSPFAAAVRSALGPEDTVIVVATRSAAAAPGRPSGFVVEASAPGEFERSWDQLTGSRQRSPAVPA